jgi:hypothetical protein
MLGCCISWTKIPGGAWAKVYKTGKNRRKTVRQQQQELGSLSIYHLQRSDRSVATQMQLRRRASPWTGTPQGGGAPTSRRKGGRESHTTKDGVLLRACVSCLAFRPAVARRNDVGSARPGAPRLPLLACYAAVPRNRIVRRRARCRRPEIPSKLTQTCRPDQSGFPSQYLRVHSTESMGCTPVRKLCSVTTRLQSLRQICSSGEEIFDHKSGGEAHSEPQHLHRDPGARLRGRNPRHRVGAIWRPLDMDGTDGPGSTWGR